MCKTIWHVYIYIPLWHRKDSLLFIKLKDILLVLQQLVIGSYSFKDTDVVIEHCNYVVFIETVDCLMTYDERLYTSFRTSNHNTFQPDEDGISMERAFDVVNQVCCIINLSSYALCKEINYVQ